MVLGGPDRLPNTSCLALPGVRADAQVIALDLLGVHVSAGAACSSGKVTRSHVLDAMGAGALAGEAIRASLPWTATEADIDAFDAAYAAWPGNSAVAPPDCLTELTNETGWCLTSQPFKPTLRHVERPRSGRAGREFSRFYTRRIGLLHEGLLGSPLTLTESRVLFELGRSGPTSATRLGKELGLDAGYLSRILRAFETGGLIERRPAPGDARQSAITLTKTGRGTFQDLDAQSAAEVGELLARLRPAQRTRLVTALRTAEMLLGERAGPPAWRLRAPLPATWGWS